MPDKPWLPKLDHTVKVDIVEERSSYQRLLLAKVSTFNFKEFKSETNHSGANTNASQIYVSFVQKNSIALHLKIFCQNCCCNVMPFAKNEIWNVFGNQKEET